MGDAYLLPMSQPRTRNTPNPWLFAIAIATAGACKSEEGDTDTASATDITGTGSLTDTGSATDAPTGTDTGSSSDAPTGTDTGAPLTPTAGAYQFSAGENGGTCAPMNTIPGSVAFIDGTVTLADGGFTLELNEFNEDPLSFTCTLSDQDFSCAALEVELWTQGDPDARAAMMMSIAGAWTSDTELSFTITGALACTGDENGCSHIATIWELELPCNMTNLHTGTLGG